MPDFITNFQFDYKTIIISIFLGLGILEILFFTFHNREKVKKRDFYIEALATAWVFLISAPLAILVSDVFMANLFPEWKDSLAYLPFWMMFIILAFADDMMQYWWHRSCHEIPILYNLHRAHHTGEYMGVRVAYRNAFVYSTLVPSLYTAAICVYLGMGEVYAVYIVLKYIVILNAHSTVKWDRFLYQHKFLKPVAWIVQRTISTPATHFAHHGKHKSDGITNYKGNYGNFFFFWDVLFGTAHISQEYPEEFGVENIGEKSWQHELMWPIWRDKEADETTEAEQQLAE